MPMPVGERRRRRPRVPSGSACTKRKPVMCGCDLLEALTFRSDALPPAVIDRAKMVVIIAPERVSAAAL